MHRFTPALALLVLPCLLLPVRAVAQNGDDDGGATGNLTISYDDVPLDNTQNALRLGGPDCESNVEITFDLSFAGGMSTEEVRNSTLEAWVSDRGTDCTNPDNRRSDTGCENAVCQFRASANAEVENIFLKANAAELFGTDDQNCPNSATRRVTLIAVDSPTDGVSCNNPAENLLPSPYNATFDILARPAGTPQNVRARDGDNDIRVSWSRGNAGLVTDSYLVLARPVSSGGGDGGSCPEVVDTNDPVTDEVLDELGDITQDPSSSLSTKLDTREIGLDYGDRVAVTVVAEDQHGNRSVAADTVCATRVETEGLVGAVEGDTGETIKTCSSTGRPGEGAAWLGGLGVLLTGLWVRRRARSVS